MEAQGVLNGRPDRSESRFVVCGGEGFAMGDGVITMTNALLEAEASGRADWQVCVDVFREEGVDRLGNVRCGFIRKRVLHLLQAESLRGYLNRGDRGPGWTEADCLARIANERDNRHRLEVVVEAAMAEAEELFGPPRQIR